MSQLGTQLCSREGEFNKSDFLLVDERLDVTWQCAHTAQEANCILSCIQSCVGSRILHVFSAHMRPALWSSAQDMDLLEQGQRQAQKMRRLEHFYEDRLRKLGLFILKKRVQADHRAASQYLKGT